MNSISELKQNIEIISKTIRKNFPEFIQYLEDVKDGDTKKDLEDYYSSLEVLLKKGNIKNSESSDNDKFSYPSSEDIYQKNKEKTEIDPENPSKTKSVSSVNSMNEKSFKEDMSGDDLDVPGSELDDQQEKIGSEDEENNYYSLGGDNHNNLEEDKG
jgi:hypothetical protein